MMFKTFICYLFFAMVTIASGLLHAKPVSVAFLAPHDAVFWQMFGGFMQAVADDLGVDLQVHVGLDDNRYGYQALAEKVLSGPHKPDYLIFICKEDVLQNMIKMTEKAGVKAFTVNTDIPDSARRAIGLPRENMANWIGHLGPDNVGVGRRMAEILWAEARTRGLVLNDGKFQLLGLSAALDSSASIDRDRGLQEAAGVLPLKINQLVRAGWSEDEAFRKMQVLLKRFPDSDAVWSASDGMALGAIKALKASGRHPGKDVLVAGVDWEVRALEAIRQGEMVTSLGGHFMDGAMALLMIFDYHNGQDFLASGTVFSYQLQPASADNVDRIAAVMQPATWIQTDFTALSRFHNPELRHQVFSADGLIERALILMQTARPALAIPEHDR